MIDSIFILSYANSFKVNQGAAMISIRHVYFFIYIVVL